jgi:hypothetical protein
MGSSVITAGEIERVRSAMPMHIRSVTSVKGDEGLIRVLFRLEELRTTHSSGLRGAFAGLSAWAAAECLYDSLEHSTSVPVFVTVRSRTGYGFCCQESKGSWSESAVARARKTHLNS